MRKMDPAVLTTVYHVALTVIIVGASAFGQRPALAQTGGGGEVCIDRATFEEEIRSRLEGDPMGYQAVLIRGAQLVAEAVGGWARSPNAGSIPMTVRNAANVGSVVKMVTSVALLSLMENPPPDARPENYLPLQDQLDLRVMPYFPAAWQAIAHSSWEQLTFRHLLTHKSGIDRRESGGIEAVLPRPLRLDELGTARKYRNNNMRVLGYLVPAYSSAELVESIDAVVQNQGLDADDPFIRGSLGDGLESVVKGQLLTGTYPLLRGGCDPVADYTGTPNPPARNYSNISDPGQGVIYSGKERAGNCKGMGGWSFSAEDLAGIFRKLGGAGEILSSQGYDAMLSRGNPGDRLGWSGTWTDPWFEEHFGFKRIYTHGGSHGFNGKVAKAMVIRFPGDFHAILIANSRLSDTTLRETAVEAFKAAIVSGEGCQTTSSPAN